MTEEEKRAVENLEEEVYSIEGLEIQEITFYSKGIEDIKIVLNLIQKLQEENKKKDKIIELMAKDLLTCGFDWIDFGKTTGNFKEDKEKLKQYFEKQAKEV